VTAPVEARPVRQTNPSSWSGPLTFPAPQAPVRPPRTSFLAFSPPSIGNEEIEEVLDTLRSDWITTGPKTHRFATEFTKYVGGLDALPLNSCTAGLHTALVTAGIATGDEVITTPMTFAASVNVIEHVGATPVMVDVEADTLNIDPSLVEKAVSARTRAIIAVHYAGHPAELDRLRKIAWRHNLVLIEDAAHALPAKYKGVRIGAGPNPVAFSFYATKNLTTAEGGMLTGDSDFLDKARVVSLHGMSRDAWRRYDKGGSWRYEILTPGFKYNMTDIAAALGLCQLRKLDAFQNRRREIVGAYMHAFSNCDALETPVERSEVDHAWHLYVLRLLPERLTIGRDQFIDELAQRNIATSVHFIPVHLHPYYRDKYQLLPDRFPVAVDNYARMLSLPLNTRMSDDDVLDVIHAVLEVIRIHRR
jgi:dTDP-4-amino-4,6-dideoxygalactose transaminase